MKMVTPRRARKSLAILGVAITSLLFAPSESQAGPVELKNIAAALSPGGVAPKTAAEQLLVVQNANSSDLANAVFQLIRTKTATAAAAYVGEALKRSNDSDFGTVMGQTLDTNRMMLGMIFFSNPDPAKNAATIAKFIGGASKAAATGTAPFAEWVDEFAAELATTNQQAYDAAKAAIASKTAVGAIIGSRLYDPTIDTDAEKLELARQAVLAKSVTITGSPALAGQGLTVASQEIARYVAAGVDDPAKFAADLLNTSATIPNSTKPATQPLLLQINKIAPGTVAGAPLKAAAVLEALFTDNGTKEAVYDTVAKKIDPTSVTPLVTATLKNASKLAASIGLYADTEEYSFIAAEFGQRIGSGVLKSTIASGIAKALVTGMVKKPNPLYNTFLGQDRNNWANRADEAGEIAAYLINAMVTVKNGDGNAANGLAIFKTNTTANAKAATALVKSIITSVVGSFKVKGSPLDKIAPTTVAADVAGSVAYTLSKLQAAGEIDSTVFNAIVTALGTDAAAKAINKTVYLDVKAALAAGFGGNDGPNGFKYEDGTVFNNQTNRDANGNPLGAVTEPETDIRGA